MHVTLPMAAAADPPTRNGNSNLNLVEWQPLF